MIGGFRGTIIAAIVVVLSCNGVASQSVNMTNVCLLVEEGTKVSAYDHCNLYYLCQGSKYTAVTCPNGEYFNKEIQDCAPAADVDCLAVITNPCESEKIGSWAANTASCGGWYYCSESGPVAGSCLPGYNFNPIRQACQLPKDYPCSIVESASMDLIEDRTTVVININICIMVRNGRHFGDPTSCESWNWCHNNRRRRGRCNKGLYYNVRGGHCTNRHNTDCEQVSDDDSLVRDEEEASCIQGSRTNSTACNEYYECVDGAYELNKCESGYLYDTETFECVEREHAMNDCDRCVEAETNFVNAFSTTGCEKFLICENGVTIGERTCPDNFYYDENQQGCYRTQPEYGCCNPDFSAARPTETTTNSGSTRTSIIYITDAPATTEGEVVTDDTDDTE